MTAKRSKKESNWERADESEDREEIPVEPAPKPKATPKVESEPFSGGGRYVLKDGVRIKIDPGTQGG